MKVVVIVDIFYVDSRSCDAKIYEEYTGGKLQIAMDNLEYLLDKVGSKRVVVRIPTIPEMVDRDKQKQAKKYFRLGEQYAQAAKLLLETLISSGNSNAGIGKTFEEAQQKMEENASRSDLYLFIPAVFDCLQSMELYIKGLLLLADKNFKRSHGVEELLGELEDCYGEDSEVYEKISSFYESQIGIIEKYKQVNGVRTSYDLYMSLRYPEITLKPEPGKKKGKKITVHYAELICNGKIGIEQFKVLIDNLEDIKLATVKEYRAKFSS